MKRLNNKELEDYLACPECGESIHKEDSLFLCNQCEARFPCFRNKPVLLTKNNELFPPSAYQALTTHTISNQQKRGAFSTIKRFVPGKSVNIARDRMLDQIASSFAEEEKVILVVGCGNQLAHLEEHFPSEKTILVFCDVDKDANTDLFCDAHELALKGNIFDGVITTAVLEHVVKPDRVVADMHRVLKQGGFIYSEVPFVLGVHEGAYDFMRFSMTGHRCLMAHFKELDSGMAAGPGTALVWSLVDFFKSMSCNSRISSGFGLGARLLFFWLKYFDYIIKNNPIAMDAASATYFYGTKQQERESAARIIERYGRKGVQHV